MAPPAQMPDAELLQSFAEQVGELLGTPCPRLKTGPDGVTAFSMIVRTVDVTVTHNTRDADMACVWVFFGPIDESREYEVMRELLRTNHQFRGSDAPSFGVDARTREAVLRTSFRLAARTGRDLMCRIEALVDIALRWREDSREGTQRVLLDATGLA